MKVIRCFMQMFSWWSRREQCFLAVPCSCNHLHTSVAWCEKRCGAVLRSPSAISASDGGMELIPAAVLNTEQWCICCPTQHYVNNKNCMKGNKKLPGSVLQGAQYMACGFGVRGPSQCSHLPAPSAGHSPPESEHTVQLCAEQLEPSEQESFKVDALNTAWAPHPPTKTRLFEVNFTSLLHKLVNGCVRVYNHVKKSKCISLLRF